MQDFLIATFVNKFTFQAQQQVKITAVYSPPVCLPPTRVLEQHGANQLEP